MRTRKGISKARKLDELHVAVIGAGKIGTSLLQAMLQRHLLSQKLIHATVQHPEKSRDAELGVRISGDNVTAARESEVVLICVKPQLAGQVMDQIAPVVSRD